MTQIIVTRMSVNLSVTELAIVGKWMEKPYYLTLFSIFNHIYLTAYIKS
jgi:hypothetical protein